MTQRDNALEDAVYPFGVREAETHHGSITPAARLLPAGVVHRGQRLAVQCQLEPIRHFDLHVVDSGLCTPERVVRNLQADRAIEID